MWIGVSKMAGANIFSVNEGVKQVAKELNAGILKDRNLLLYVNSDETSYVESALGLVKKNIVFGGLLTVGVLLVFLRDGRSTLVIAIAIPVSIIGTFLLLSILGRSLNVISLAGMAFAVGMLVDNAVVVLENIFRHRQMGADPITASVRGTKEVWGAALSSTLTTMAVFIPILFVREEAGQLFRDIALAISCGVGLSLLVSVVVIPTAAARVLRPRSVTYGTLSSLHRQSEWIARPFVAAVVDINTWLQRSKLRRLVTVVGFVSAAGLLSYWLLPAIEYLPKGNRNLISGNMYPKPGLNVDELLRIGSIFHERLRPYAEVAPGSKEAAALDYPVLTDLSYGTWSGHIWMSTRAENASQATKALPLLQEIADDIKAETDIEASVNQMGLFVGGWNRPARSIDIDVRGPDLNRLVELATHIKEQATERIPGATSQAFPSLELSAPELHVIPRKHRAAELELNSDQLGYNISAFVDGAYVTEYLDNGDEIPLTIVSNESDALDTAAIPIVVPSGHVVPLSSVADVSYREGPQQIMHKERKRAIVVSVSPPETMALGEAIDVIEKEILGPLRASGELKGVYEISLSGTADKLMATWEALRFNLLVVLLITYLLMAALFESWLYPLVIMVSVPMAAVGGLAGLRIMNLFVIQQLDILTMLGFIILVGTVVNNAILIVHQSLNHMRDDQMPMQSAIIMSVRNRVRPIFMTTFTTTFGLIPLVVLPGSGSELYRGIGSVVLGGLLTSTIFTLFLVPSLFSLTLEAKAWIQNTLHRRPDVTSTAEGLRNDVAEPVPSPRQEEQVDSV
jgi:HAE1 family hydrophobic/amphiphilic exporter-1